MGPLNDNGRMSARWVTFLVWALVAASAVAWGLKLFVTAPGAPPQVSVAAISQLPRGDVTRVLGADAVPTVDPSAGESVAPAADARFQLLGVVAPRGNETARGGVALIAVDGKPPRAFRVGALVDGENALQAVRARGADLGPMGGKVAVALNIPPPAMAATGTLPDARSPGATGAAAAPGAFQAPAGRAPMQPVPGAAAATPPPPAVRRTGVNPAGSPPVPPVVAPVVAPTPVQPLFQPGQPGPGQVVPLPNTSGSPQPQIK
jgi:general secretion pathway protein C